MKNGKAKDKIIVIGGSSGALEAIVQILAPLPENFRYPIAIVLHRLAQGKSELQELLQSKTILKVDEPLDKQPIIGGNIYLAPQDYHLMVEDNRTFSYSYSEAESYSRPSIDVLFQTAADTFGIDTVGVLLSGANSDGVDGISRIREYGGLTVVQDPKSARMPIMPEAVLKQFRPDHILNSENIGNLLIELNNAK